MYVLGIDFGGGASKATLLKKDGTVAATAEAEYKTVSKADGTREQKPSDWLDVALKNIKAVITKAGISGSDIDCLCFDAATHTAVLLDNNFNVLRNAVYWTDTRCIKEKDFLEENYSKDIFSRFRHKVDTIWTLPQLLWIKQNEPEIFEKTKKIMFAKDYVRYFFTGDLKTDYIEAEGSMLYNPEDKKWDKRYLDILGLSENNLPEIVNPEDLAGCVTEQAAKISGLKEGTHVICGTTDTAMEVFAVGAVDKGQTTVKLATAGRICVVSDKPYPDENLINYSHIVKGLYYPGTATKSCAASLRWFKDAFGGEYLEMDKAAEKIAVGSDGLLFHPYLSGELTPYGNPKLKADFTGISATHSKAHFVRSVLEGVAFSLLDCKRYLESKGLKIDKKAFIIGGGAKSALWRQIVSDMLNLELVSTLNNDSSFGSAMLAGVFAGYFSDEKEALEKCSKNTGITYPDKNNNAIYEKLFVKYKKVQKALEAVYNA